MNTDEDTVMTCRQLFTVPATGYTWGQSMSSVDGGHTWIPTWMLPVPETLVSFEVTGVDHEQGVVTVSAVRS